MHTHRYSFPRTLKIPSASHNALQQLTIPLKIDCSHFFLYRKTIILYWKWMLKHYLWMELVHSLKIQLWCIYLYSCSPHRVSRKLWTLAQSKPYHEKPFNQGLLQSQGVQSQGALYPIQTILTIAARISFSSFVRVSTRQLVANFLPKGISSTFNFHESIEPDGTRTRNLTHRKGAPYQLS